MLTFKKSVCILVYPNELNQLVITTGKFLVSLGAKLDMFSIITLDKIIMSNIFFCGSKT